MEGERVDTVELVQVEAVHQALQNDLILLRRPLAYPATYFMIFEKMKTIRNSADLT